MNFSTLYFSTPDFSTPDFQSGVERSGVGKFIVEKSRVEMSGVEMSFKLIVRAHFNPELINHGLSSPGFFIPRNGVENPGLKSSWLKCLGLESSWLKSSRLKFGVEVSFNSSCLPKIYHGDPVHNL